MCRHGATRRLIVPRTLPKVEEKKRAGLYLKKNNELMHTAALRRASHVVKFSPPCHEPTGSRLPDLLSKSRAMHTCPGRQCQGVSTRNPADSIPRLKICAGQYWELMEREAAPSPALPQFVSKFCPVLETVCELGRVPAMRAGGGLALPEFPGVSL